MAHDYVASPPISLGLLRRKDPVRTVIPIVGEVLATSAGGSVLWTPPAQLTCNLIYDVSYDYADWEHRSDPLEVALDVPATVEGEPVVAVELHVGATIHWFPYGTGGPDSPAIVNPDNCFKIFTQTRFDGGDNIWTMHVDDTEVVHILGEARDIAPGDDVFVQGDQGGGFRGTLILKSDGEPYRYREETGLPSNPDWVVAREPFQPLPFASSIPASSTLFWGPAAAGQTLPETFSISAKRFRVQEGYVATRHFPPDSTEPVTVGFADSEISEIEVTVDVYPYIEQAPPEGALMMVV